MSKKKSTTKKTTTDADHPAVLPRKKAGPAKKKGKTQPPAAPNVTASETADAGPALPPGEMPPPNAADGKKQGKAKEAKPKKMSCLDAAAKVLADAGAAMTTGEMIDAMGKANLWSSPNGRTPAATLYSAVLREINTKGTQSRFTKTERGKFAAKA
jgi:hypothetical protein